MQEKYQNLDGMAYALEQEKARKRKAKWIVCPRFSFTGLVLTVHHPFIGHRHPRFAPSSRWWRRCDVVFLSSPK